MKGCNCLFINDREGQARGKRIRSSETICKEIGAVDYIREMCYPGPRDSGSLYFVSEIISEVQLGPVK